MTSKIKKLKALGLEYIDSTFATLKSSKPIEAAQIILDKAQSITTYFKSTDYEDDLDEIIEILYILRPTDKPDFSEHKVLKKRLKAKAKFVRAQVVLFIVASGSAGLEIGSYFYNPKIGLIIGTTAGVLIVSFVAGQIIIRRMGSEDLDRQLRTV